MLKVCDPVTIMAAGGAAINAYSAISAGQNQKDVARFNAREAENKATRLRNKGVEEENKHRQKVAQLQSTQRARLGASNVDVGFGSALQIQDDTALFGEVDALRIRSNFSDEADSADRSAELLRDQGDASARAGIFQAVGSLLTAGGGGIESSGVSSKWYNADSSATSSSVIS